MENRIFLNRYRLSLGRNGSPIEMHRAPAARIYRGHEIDTGREVALTIVSPAPSDPVVLGKLETESIASEEVNHINLPRLYDFGRENDELIYVSEYWEGHTASAWVEARGPLTVAAALRVALQVTDAMNATVFQRIYHPALNPDNILFVAGQTGEGDWPPIKILNWRGPVPALTQSADAAAESAARFAAPEQLREGKVDVRSEIYSLGATMWFLLTGLPPAAGDSGALGGAISKLRGVPKIVRHLLERMARPDPGERPQDPVALASYLQTCLDRVERRSKMERRFGIPLATHPRVVAPRTPMPLKRLAAALAVMIVATLALLGMTLALTSPRPAPLGARTNQLSESAPDESNLPNESNLPSEATVAENNLSEKSVAAPAISSPTAVAAVPSPSHEELISLPPSPASAEATTASNTDALPADQMKTSESAQVSSEPSPPKEGPTTENDARIANNHEVAPPENVSPNESTPTPSSMAEDDKPRPATVVETPVQLADSVDTTGAKALPSATPVATPRKALVSTDASKKSRAKSAIHNSRVHLAKERARGSRTVKRAQALPKLRVGTAPAEFVGTTRKGDWILSVDTTGERIIVPPPPGYEQ